MVRTLVILFFFFTFNSRAERLKISADSIDIASQLLPVRNVNSSKLLERQHNLPVVYVTTDPANLWDFNTGIYVLGPNASTQNPYRGANFWEDWEKPVHIEIYDENGDPMINQDAGVKIFGAWSRAKDQKSLAFFARSEYGKGSFSFKLFPEKNIDKFESFILRNNGNDWNGAMFRDAIIGQIAGEMDLDHQAFQPIVLYLNGEYWGIMNMREKINEHFIASNHRVIADNVNILEGEGELIAGSRDSYDELLNFVNSNNLQNDASYEEVKSRMDVENFARYWALMVYIDNRDWPRHNSKYWSTNAPGSKFRWIIYDTDYAFSTFKNDGEKYNTLIWSLSEGRDIEWANREEATVLYRSLIANHEFRNVFINTMADLMNTVFIPEHFIAVVDSFEQLIYQEAPYHFARWPSGSMESWNNKLTDIRNFIQARPAYMQKFIIDRFLLSGTADISVGISEPAAGCVKINTRIPESYPFYGTYFKGVPIQLEAIPAPGYLFSHWEGSASGNNQIVGFDMNSSGSFTANFVKAENSVINVVINEINYSSSSTKDTKDWVELYNNSNVAVDLSNWKLTDTSDGNYFLIPEGTTMQPGAFLVINRSLPDFKQFYPNSSPVLGNFDFGLSSSGDSLMLKDDSGILRDVVNYKSLEPWPQITDETASIELISPDFDNSLPESWSVSLGSGTPCLKNSRFVTGIETVSEEQKSLNIQVYPTLFHGYTTIRLNASKDEFVNISAIDVSGRVVDVILNQKIREGSHSFEWNPEKSKAQPGLYFIRISTNSSVQTYKVIRQ